MSLLSLFIIFLIYSFLRHKIAYYNSDTATFQLFFGIIFDHFGLTKNILSKRGFVLIKYWFCTGFYLLSIYSICSGG